MKNCSDHRYKASYLMSPKISFDKKCDEECKVKGGNTTKRSTILVDLKNSFKFIYQLILLAIFFMYRAVLKSSENNIIQNTVVPLEFIYRVRVNQQCVYK